MIVGDVYSSFHTFCGLPPMCPVPRSLNLKSGMGGNRRGDTRLGTTVSTLGCSKIGGTPPPYTEIPDFRKHVPDHPELLRKCQKWIRHEILQFLESKIFFLTPSEEKVIGFSYPSARRGVVHQFCCNLEYSTSTYRYHDLFQCWS